MRRIRRVLKYLIFKFLGASGLDWVRTAIFLRQLDTGESPLREPEIRMLTHLIKQGDRVLDIGANYGIYTYHLSQIVGDSGHVYSVEPLPGPFKILSTLRKRKGLKNVSLHRVALADAASGSATMQIPLSSHRGIPDYGRAQLSKGRAREDCAPSEKRTISVATVTLDRLLGRLGETNLSFIKCDVEGAELLVFRGARQLLGNHPPSVILCEVEARHTAHFGHTTDDVKDFFAEFGFEPYIQEHPDVEVLVPGFRDGNVFFIFSEQSEELLSRLGQR